MLRFLIKFLLFAIILTAALMFAADWKLNDDLQTLIRKASPVADLSYESASVSYTGDIKINDIRAYVEALDARIQIGELRYSVGNLYELAVFESNLSNGQLPERASISLKNVLLPFSRKMLKSTAGETPFTGIDLLQSAYCGEINQFGLSQYEAMGYSYLAFDTSIFYMLDKYSGSAIINGRTSLEEAADVEYQINIGSVMSWFESLNAATANGMVDEIVQPDLVLFEIKWQDRGLNTSIAAYCALQQGVSREEYYSGHVDKVEAMLAEAGITLLEPLKKAYAESIKPESQVLFYLQPKASFEFKGVTFYDYAQLLELSGFRLSVNNKPVSELLDNWSFENFAKIAETKREAIKKQQRSQESYREVEVKRLYRQYSVARASGFIGDKVRVTRKDGSVYEGKLIRTGEKRIWVRMRSKDGEIELPLQHGDISRFEVFVVIPVED